MKKILPLPVSFKDLNPIYINAGNYDSQPIESMENLFAECENLKDVELTGLDTSHIKNMGSMYASCRKLESIDISKLNTKNVEDMNSMFENCSSLKHIDLSGINTSKVEYTYCMFSGCSSLVQIDLSNLDFSNVQDAGEMFDGCKSLKYLNLSNFNTSNLECTDRMFADCKSLEILDLSNWDFKESTSCYEMFEGCDNLRKIILKGCNPKTIENIFIAFWCSHYRLIDIEIDNNNSTKLALHCHCGEFADKPLNEMRHGFTIKPFHSKLAAYYCGVLSYLNENVIPKEQGVEFNTIVEYPVFCEVGSDFSVFLGDGSYGFAQSYITFKLMHIYWSGYKIACVKLQVVKSGSYKDFIAAKYEQAAEKSNLKITGDDLGSGGDLYEGFTSFVDDSGIEHLIQRRYYDFEVDRVDFGDTILNLK